MKLPLSLYQQFAFINVAERLFNHIFICDILRYIMIYFEVSLILSNQRARLGGVPTATFNQVLMYYFSVLHFAKSNIQSCML